MPGGNRIPFSKSLLVGVEPSVNIAVVLVILVAEGAFEGVVEVFGKPNDTVNFYGFVVLPVAGVLEYAVLLIGV